jgi:hypothetical protein
MTGYQRIESEIQKRREQAESVRGKDTPFRVMFCYEGGTRHYQYFVNEQDAAAAEDSMCLYGPTGNPIIREPRDQQMQMRGPRGGWKRLAAHGVGLASGIAHR